MNQKECYTQGYETGYDIAEDNAGDYNLLDEAERELFVSAMLEHESDVYRQYSPFESFARDINACGDRAEELWDAYEDGVYKGICALVKEQVSLLRNTHE
jgi:hypothetical protein